MKVLCKNLFISKHREREREILTNKHTVLSPEKLYFSLGNLHLEPKIAVTMSDVTEIVNWTCDDVIKFVRDNQIEDLALLDTLKIQKIDGKTVLALNESDIRDIRLLGNDIHLGDAKRLWIVVRQLQRDNATSMANLGLIEREISCSGGGGGSGSPYNYSQHSHHSSHQSTHHHHHHHQPHQQHYHGACCSLDSCGNPDFERTSPPLSVDGRATSIKPEFFKTMISLCNVSRSNPLCFVKCNFYFLNLVVVVVVVAPIAYISLALVASITLIAPIAFVAHWSCFS